MSKVENSSKINNLHDGCNQVILFHNHIVRFFRDINKTFTDESISLQISDAVKYYKSLSRSDYIKETNTALNVHINMIKSYSEIIFSESYSSELILIPKLDIRKIWTHLENLDNNTVDIKNIKKALFNHLHAIYITSELSMNQINKFNIGIKKQKDLLLDMLNNLKIDDKIKERVDELRKEDETKESADSMDFMGKLQELLGEDNFLLELAKEISEEININDSISDDPTQTIRNLFADDGKKIQELIMKLTEKLDEKIKSGKFTHEKLFEEAQKVKNKVSSLAPELGKMFEQYNSTDKMKENVINKFEFLNTELKNGEFKDIPEIMKKNIDQYTEGDIELIKKLMEFE